MTNCHTCNEPIIGKWDSQVQLGLETGELDKESAYQHFIYDKHIKCSPSRAQRIIHPKFATVVDSRPQFDMRRGDNSWTNERREKFRKLYTDSWVALQEKYNPSWIIEQDSPRGEGVSLWSKELTRR